MTRSQQDASHIITHLSDFFDWLGEMRPEVAKVNPRYAGGAFDRQTDEAAYQYRRSRVFLGHTWATNASPSETGHRVRTFACQRIGLVVSKALGNNRLRSIHSPSSQGKRDNAQVGYLPQLTFAFKGATAAIASNRTVGISYSCVTPQKTSL